MAYHRVLSIRLDEGLFGLRPRVAETRIEAHVPELLRCRLGAPVMLWPPSAAWWSRLPPEPSPTFD